MLIKKHCFKYYFTLNKMFFFNNIIVFLIELIEKFILNNELQE